MTLKSEKEPEQLSIATAFRPASSWRSADTAKTNMPKRTSKPARRRSVITPFRRRVLFVVAVTAVSVCSGWAVVHARMAPDNATRGFMTANRDAKDKGAGKGADTHQQNRARQAAKNDKDAKNTMPNKDDSKVAKPVAPTPVATAAQKAAQAAAAAAAVAPAGLHQGIITTIFWAGEAADANNAYISNAPSAWDELWQEHYGGYDDPAHRNGWYPAAFTPKENPFYFALPYNDYDEQGKRKASASKCSAITGVTAANTSWCKNAWIKITKNGKAAYAQWQDVGPMLEDDANYVFGTAKPGNTWGAKAGLDVSPAVRDYLGLKDVDTTDWSFVPASAVPAGPWKQIVTTSGVFWQ